MALPAVAIVAGIGRLIWIIGALVKVAWAGVKGFKHFQSAGLLVAVVVLIAAVKEYGAIFFDLLLSWAIPDWGGVLPLQVVEAYAFVNYLLPLDYALNLLFAYMAAWGVARTIRFWKKLIPGM